LRRRADRVRADAREWAEERFRGLFEQLRVTVYIDAVDRLSTALYISPQYDITERKLAEHALHEAEDRFRAIVEHMPGAIYLDQADSSMQPVFVSPQIERITGVTSEEWMASTDAWVDLVHPEDRGRVVDGYLAAMAARRPWADNLSARPVGLGPHPGRHLRRHRAEVGRASAPRQRAT
jgi:PAS domain-containing protein